MCNTHYEHSRRGVVSSELRPKKRNRDDEGIDRATIKFTGCAHAGCDKKKSGNYCPKHYAQFKKYGFTWDSKTDYRLMKIREEARAARPECLVPTCTEEVRSLRVNLCTDHERAKYILGTSDEHYIKLLAVELCESCGSKERLVTDHDHSHHEDSRKMCEQCIRGRLCNGCNAALGFLKEDVTKMRMLIKYTEKHRGRQYFD